MPAGESTWSSHELRGQIAAALMALRRVSESRNCEIASRLWTLCTPTSGRKHPVLRNFFAQNNGFYPCAASRSLSASEWRHASNRLHRTCCPHKRTKMHYRSLPRSAPGSKGTCYRISTTKNALQAEGGNFIRVRIGHQAKCWLR